MGYAIIGLATVAIVFSIIKIVNEWEYRKADHEEYERQVLNAQIKYDTYKRTMDKLDEIEKELDERIEDPNHGIPGIRLLDHLKEPRQEP